MKNRIRYTVEKILNNSFYQMPKFLFTGECSTLSNDARVLYMLLKDRHELSVKNKWYNDKGEVYLIMKREEMQSMLNLAPLTVRKVLKELKDLNLIEEERQGLNKPNLLYLLEYNNLTLRSVKNIHSGTSKSNTPDCKKMPPNHTNQNHNHQNHTNRSKTNLIDSEDTLNHTSHKPLTLTQTSDSMDSVNNIENNSPSLYNINLDKLNSKYFDRADEIKNIYSILFETFISNQKSFRIGKVDVPYYTVKQALHSLDNRHIEYVLDSLKKKNNSANSLIKNSNAYILTALFNASKLTFFDIDAIKNDVSLSISLDNLLIKYPHKQGELLEIFDIIVEMLASTKKSVRIAKEDTDISIVKNSFSKLNSSHIEYVLDSLSKITSSVKNTKSYIQTALWNAPKTINNHYSLEVQHDFADIDD